jgi:ADP-ribose pyrophosphatase
LDLTEKKLNSEQLYDGKIVKLFRDTVELPNGKTALREVVRHPGGVIILPIDNDGNVHLVRQFRYAYDRAILEIPAGKLDHGAESIETAARRELSEETGLEAEEMVYLGKSYASPGFCTEELHVYLARGLKQSDSHPDEDEFVEAVKMPFNELLEQVMSGEIVDAKTVIAVLKTKILLDREK